MDKLNQVSMEIAQDMRAIYLRLIFIAATVAGVVIGVLQFLYRAWHSNDVGTKLKSITYRVFSVLKTISTTIVDELDTSSTIEVAPKSAKRKRTLKQSLRDAELQVG